MFHKLSVLKTLFKLKRLELREIQILAWINLKI